MANVGFGLRIRGVDQKEVHSSVKHFLALVGLTGFEERDARALSGGEARRVALARALACRPQVLLLDEPMAHVDQKSAEIIEQIIASQSQAGTTIVMASHHEQVGERLSPSMILLKDGRIASDHKTAI
jgi:tungstate transport system ATP-binding protein